MMPQEKAMANISKDLRTRKDEHLDLCANNSVNSTHPAGWDEIEIPHCAAPEINFQSIDVTTQFLGHRVSAPIMISSMTGGSAEGEKLNALLSEFAQQQNIPMGVGSQRIQLENKDLSLFNLRKHAPKSILYANIGLVQFNYGVGVDDCQWLVDKLEASALILHLNPLQEAIQFEGNRDFSNLLKNISVLKKKLSVPVILKETGCGLDLQTAKRALEEGADALDIAGRGGTHWGYIEGLRHNDRLELGEMFRNWGTPSADLLVQLRKHLGASTILISSGGLRHGLDVAKAMHLGANMTAMAQPFLKAAKLGPASLEQFFKTQVEALKIAMFCSGAKNLEELLRK